MFKNCVFKMSVNTKKMGESRGSTFRENDGAGGGIDVGDRCI